VGHRAQRDPADVDSLSALGEKQNSIILSEASEYQRAVSALNNPDASRMDLHFY